MITFKGNDDMMIMMMIHCPLMRTNFFVR